MPAAAAAGATPPTVTNPNQGRADLLTGSTHPYNRAQADRHGSSSHRNTRATSLNTYRAGYRDDWSRAVRV